MKYFIYYLWIINTAAFFLSFYDKRAAVRHKQRIAERTLFILAAAGGSIGLYLSMLVFRHKTKHPSFMLGVPAIIAAQLLCLWYFFKA